MPAQAKEPSPASRIVLRFSEKKIFGDFLLTNKNVGSIVTHKISPGVWDPGRLPKGFVS